MEKQLDPKSLLTIKVLRLLKPSLVGPLALACDHHDLAGDLWQKELSADITSVSGIGVLSLGNFLRLPQGFGNMYLGELFSSYVVVQNEGSVLVTDVSCKVELQTQSQKFVLANKKALEDLKFGSTIDIVMHHEIKEMGKHMLIVTLQYTVPTISPEAIVLERYFKFQVKKPLDVKTKLYNSESDEVFLEAQVQNITSAPICLEKVELEPSPAFNCIKLSHDSDSLLGLGDLASVRQNQSSGSSKWPNKMLDQDDSFQFLYRLTPKSDQARSAVSIGKLDITWRTAVGDRGRLQTSQLQRQPPILNDLKLVVTKIPDTCLVDTPSELTVKLSNTTSDRRMDLQLELEDSLENYCWLGTTKYKLGELTGSSQIDISLCIFPLKAGLITVSGIRITDGTKGEKFLFNDIVSIRICPSPAIPA